MARLVRRIPALARYSYLTNRSETTIFSAISRPRHLCSPASTISQMRKSASQENLLRIIRNEIDYEFDVRPPKEPIKKFNDFLIEERPGEPYIRLTRSHNEKEVIKVDATMFDGYSTTSPDERNDDPGGDMKLHISLVVDILKGESATGGLHFICSAWPDALVIQKVFFNRSEAAPSWAYVGPDFRELDDQLQETLMAYLKDRGVDKILAEFLHGYLASKDVRERIRWLENIKRYVEM